MKIIYIHQYFNTPQDGGSLRSYYIARAFIAQGFEVEMITSHNHKKYLAKKVAGIQVHYLPVYYDNSLGTMGRIWAFLRFLWKGYQQAKSISNASVCYATSTPLTVGLIALWLKKRQKVSYVFEVRDLWPQAPIEMGFIKNTLLQKLLYRVEKKIYQNAEKIIALSPGMQEDIEQKVSSKKVQMIPNMSDIQFFAPEEQRLDLRQKYAVEGKFVVSYIGTIGLANHLEYLLDIASFFQQKALDNVIFFMVGKGGRANVIQQKARELELGNVRFIPHQSKEKIREILTITEAVYISFWDKPVLQTNSPNKFFDALAAGKLCIVNTSGWLKELVEENACGFYASPEKPEEFYRNLEKFIENFSLLKKYQKNAQELAKTHFNKDFLAREIVKVLERLKKK